MACSLLRIRVAAALQALRQPGAIPEDARDGGNHEQSGVHGPESDESEGLDTLPEDIHQRVEVRSTAWASAAPPAVRSTVRSLALIVLSESISL